MLMFVQIKHIAIILISKIFKKFSPVRWKEFNELNYWKYRKKIEGVFSNKHYEYFYTTHFGLDISYYKNMTILDIGCGPRGSLEWASSAFLRIGLDPLAREYLHLGINKQLMEYIAAYSESIPLKEEVCHAVFSFNSLDHVVSIEKTIMEIKRVVRPGGIFLLIVEVNHSPTVCEPHKLNPTDLIRFLKPEFYCEQLQVYAPGANGIYDSILADKKLPNPVNTNEKGYLSAKFIKSKN